MSSNAKFTRRELLLGAARGVVALGLSRFVSPSELRAETPKKGGKLVYAITNHNTRHKSLKTAMHPYDGIEIRTKNTYNTLTWVTEDLEPVPEIATSWEAVSDDQKIWEVTIREGVKFHDGRDLTVDDVVSSYKFHKDKKKGTSFAKKMLADVEKVGP
ncbi:MAG: ABC transporter substrate-binding protein, partial [Acidiferrobacterales bacterium]